MSYTVHNVRKCYVDLPFPNIVYPIFSHLPHSAYRTFIACYYADRRLGEVMGAPDLRFWENRGPLGDTWEVLRLRACIVLLVLLY